jgi:hypothetical protein
LQVDASLIRNRFVEGYQLLIILLKLALKQHTSLQEKLSGFVGIEKYFELHPVPKTPS